MRRFFYGIGFTIMTTLSVVLIMIMKGIAILVATAASFGPWLPKTLHIFCWVFCFFFAIYVILIPFYVIKNMSVMPLVEGIISSLVLGFFCEVFAQMIDWKRQDGS